MIHGDLSNTSGVTIAFRCVGFLVKYKETTIKDKVLNALLGKTRRAEIDDTVREMMEHLYRNTEYNVDLVIENKDYTEDLKQLVDSMPYNRVVLIDKMTQISSRLVTGDISFYVDDDPVRRSLVNSQYAVSLDNLSRYVRRRTIKWQPTM